ncbi:MAG: aminoacetone oxidase family FAD-binding enzyme [Clostridia bacterium]|nr:aminoacetone oxidase family FAD-binding enzyme [Clostridia bacterium]
MYDVAIIGGGASGICAAIHAAENLKNGKVVILEKNQRTGKKLLTTGNGRCNLTNMDISLNHFHTQNPGFVKNIFENFGFDDTKNFFSESGIIYYNEGNKVFPNSLQAASVVDMLRFRATEANVEEICNFNCVSVEYKNCFLIKSKDGKLISSKTLIFACGGKAAPQSGTDGSSYDILKVFGHRMTHIFPSLVQLVGDSKKTVPLKGVKVNGNISVFVDDVNMKTDSGEVLFTEYGVSGPPVFQISRIVSEAVVLKKKCYITLDLLPSYSENEVYSLLKSRNKNLTLDVFTNGLFNKAVGRELIKTVTDYKLNLKANVLKDEELKKLSKTVKEWKFDIHGTKGWESAQVTAGGIKLDNFNCNSMESKLCEGLFACGEVLDVDGDCGGFNLQWAWSSGAVAGKSAAQKIKGM